MAKLYQYLNKDGEFDYQSYSHIQRKGNLNKWNVVWAEQDNIQYLASRVSNRLGSVEFGICHGTRTGLEQVWFEEALECRVLGTDISSDAVRYGRTIEWDFHHAKNEWSAATCFIYSNSWDHSYDPQKCFQTWVDCLRINGLMLLDHSSTHTPESVNRLDPFGAYLGELVVLMMTWHKNLSLVEIVDDLPVQEKVLELGEQETHVKNIKTLIFQKTS
jgi:hypothetical protein